MPSQATPFEFVVIDPASNLKPGKSLQIRSRCMRGQNKRGNSRRAQRDEKRATKEANQVTSLPHRREPVTEWVPPPDTLISDMALIRFARPGIDNEGKALLFKAFAYNFANQSLSPLERCVDFDCLESTSFEWAFSDGAFLHSVLSTSYAINDFMTPHWDGKPGAKTLYHLRKSLSLLQAKMSDENVYQDESVLLVVMNLAILSAVYGDWPAAAAHYKGLHKIVELRGKFAYLKDRPKLHFKLDRIDLAMTLSSGYKTWFLQPTTSWDTEIPPPYLPLPVGLYQPSLLWDYRLANLFQDFQYLSLRINRNALKRVTHDPACFHAVLTSLQSRLVNVGDLVQTPIEELVRLTMMAFLTTTFKTPGRQLPYTWVIKRLGEVYETVASDPCGLDTTLRLWVLMTIAFTVHGTQQEWVQKAWRETELGLTWENVRSQLLQVMWIEIIHDKPGEAAFYELEVLRFA